MDEDIQALIEDGSILSCTEGRVKFDWPVFRTLHPEVAKGLWLEHLADVDRELFDLQDKGLVNLDVQVKENGEFDLMVSLTDAGEEALG